MLFYSVVLIVYHHQAAPNSLQFLGDQGRDSMIVTDIFTKADLVFIGPVTNADRLLFFM